VKSSNLGRDTGYLDHLPWLSSVISENIRYGTSRDATTSSSLTSHCALNIVWIPDSAFE
jgi:hypothetical protein